MSHNVITVSAVDSLLLFFQVTKFTQIDQSNVRTVVAIRVVDLVQIGPGHVTLLDKMNNFIRFTLHLALSYRRSSSRMYK